MADDIGSTMAKLVKSRLLLALARRRLLGSGLAGWQWQIPSIFQYPGENMRFNSCDFEVLVPQMQSAVLVQQ